MVSRPFLGQPVGLADGGVQVDGQERVAGSGPSRPGPGQQLPAHPIRLTNVASPETAQERPQGGWRLNHTAQNPGRPASAQRVGVGNAVAAANQSLPPRKRGAEATRVIILSPVLARPGAPPKLRCRSTSLGSPRCRARVAGRSSPTLPARRWSSKATWMGSGWLSGSIYRVLLVWGGFCVSETIIPEAPEHFLTPSTHRDTHLFGGLGLRRNLSRDSGGGVQAAHPSARDS